MLSCEAVKGRYCWPQTAVNHSVNVSCHLIDHPGVDSSKYFSRYCLSTGNWSTLNVTGCFYPDVLDLIVKSYLHRPYEERVLFERALRILRYIEIAGLSISLTSILISLLIFFTIKSLYNSRTKIHINLLIAILIQILARVVTYGLQMAQVKHSSQDECTSINHIFSSRQSVLFDNVCSVFIILLQFGITAMFMWMLCEGIHLNTVLTFKFFKEDSNTMFYHIIGWVVPFCLTLSWSAVMFIKERRRRCFNNYNHLSYYWIIDGPRYAVMIINIVFLLNIIRVLFVKIKEGSEKQVREEKRRSSMNTKLVRKAVRAAIFLLPLLGITHFLETFISVDDQSLRIFLIYSSASVLLMTLQGFFCSLLYCFLNGEVREKISRRFQSTRIGYSWKKYSSKQGQLTNGKSINVTEIPLETNKTSSAKKKNPIAFEAIHLTSNEADN